VTSTLVQKANVLFVCGQTYMYDINALRFKPVTVYLQVASLTLLTTPHLPTLHEQSGTRLLFVHRV